MEFAFLNVSFDEYFFQTLHFDERMLDELNECFRFKIIEFQRLTHSVQSRVRGVICKSEMDENHEMCWQLPCDVVMQSFTICYSESHKVSYELQCQTEGNKNQTEYDG